MPVDCQRYTTGGKGNMGMFVERDPKICAAGLPTQQPDEKVSDSLQHYLLKDVADALLSDAIIPPPVPKPLPPLRKPIPLDKRNAGPFSQVAELVNPPNKTKFQSLVEDLKDTVFSSYWKKPLGRGQDPVPMLPEGMNSLETTFGKKTPYFGRLYDVTMPKEPLPDKTPRSKMPGVQVERNYCQPPFSPELTYGHRTTLDKRGIYSKCCVTDDRILVGTAQKTIVNTIQANFQDAKQSRLATVLAPNNNVSQVPEGYTFGILKPPDYLPDCLAYCEINPDKKVLRKCLGHLNLLRKCLSKRFLPNFFRECYLNLKHFDELKTGWLPKEVVYDYCGSKLIRFDPALIEPILSMWQAFDGSKIEYKTFVHVINYREPSPNIPKILDIPDKCLDFHTTYRDMVQLDQPKNTCRMAGLPSGRYFDLDYPVTPENCCKAARTCLPHESDMKTCITPSVMTLLNVTHRDLFAKREPEIVRKVFEATGEVFTNETFSEIWEEAKKFHSAGWVCFETFRRVLENKNMKKLQNK